ncbi:hypothetical protein DID80_00425 [Candidatus Marinamargulisbacteria bacterium SCGC AAA071-K20]|nr:hypothetical protein DID80_00425 [Candidatus Marinamargulisbacteria bacterium SCGC AAA071-K20]
MTVCSNAITTERVFNYSDHKDTFLKANIKTLTQISGVNISPPLRPFWWPKGYGLGLGIDHISNTAIYSQLLPLLSVNLHPFPKDIVQQPTHITGSKNGLIAITEAKQNNVVLFKMTQVLFKPTFIKRLIITYPTKCAFNTKEQLYVLSKNNTFTVYEKHFERNIPLEKTIQRTLHHKKIIDFKLSQHNSLFILTNDMLYILSENGFLITQFPLSKKYSHLGVNFYEDIFLLTPNNQIDQFTSQGQFLLSTPIKTKDNRIEGFFLYDSLGIVVFTNEQTTWTMAESPQFTKLSLNTISKSNQKTASILHFTLTSPSLVSIELNEQHRRKSFLNKEFMKSGTHQFLIEAPNFLDIKLSATSVFDSKYKTSKIISF